MNEYQAKTTNAKIQRAKKLKELKKASGQLSTKQHKELLDSISSLQANISSLEASLSANGTSYTESQKDLVQNFSTLQEILQSGLNVNNLKDIKQAKEIIVSNLKDIPKPVINTHKTEIPKWLASDKSVQVLNDNVIKVVQALIDLEANIKPSQNAEEFVPFRRVIRQGNRLVFDDSDWASRAGGGGSGGGTTGGLTDAELRATPVPVSMSSDIEIGAVELKNGTDDTRAEVTAGNALKVDGSAVTQPVSGTVTATPTGTQNVDVTANTIGLATSAKQDTIIGHVDGVETLLGTTNSTLGTIDADTGSLASTVVGGQLQVDLAAVSTTLYVEQPTGSALQTTEANSAAIKTAVETIDNAIAGSEMQVDVVGALPAGTNAIGKLAANSGVDIGDVDVTSAVSSSFDHGSNRDIDATAEQITSTSFACKFGVTVKADITNTGIIYIGNSDVTAGTTAGTDGFPLSAGETLTLEVNNPNLLYAIASTTNQIIYWSAV